MEKTYNEKLVLFSVSGDSSFLNYNKTVVSTKNITDYNIPIQAWGRKNTSYQRRLWNKLSINDTVLFYRKKYYISVAQISGLIESNDISQKLWGYDKNNTTWELIIFLKNFKTIDISQHILNNELGYNRNFCPTRILDFTIVNNEKCKELLQKYGNFKKFLNKLQDDTSPK